MKNRNFAAGVTLASAVSFALCALFLAAALLPSGARAQAKAAGDEEIVARVNSDVITLAAYQKAEQHLRDEVARDCQDCPQEKIAARFKDQQKDLLRGMIDESLIVQRAKDMGVNVEADVNKRLDEVRQQNDLATLDDLKKGVEASGLSWEDYKTTIRNALLQKEVVRREVGSHVDITARRSEAILRRAPGGIHAARARGAL